MPTDLFSQVVENEVGNRVFYIKVPNKHSPTQNNFHYLHAEQKAKPL
jgi:hypothetical protein